MLRMWLALAALPLARGHEAPAHYEGRSYLLDNEMGSFEAYESAAPESHGTRVQLRKIARKKATALLREYTILSRRHPSSLITLAPRVRDWTSWSHS